MRRRTLLLLSYILKEYDDGISHASSKKDRTSLRNLTVRPKLSDRRKCKVCRTRAVRLQERWNKWREGRLTAATESVGKNTDARMTAEDQVHRCLEQRYE